MNIDQTINDLDVEIACTLEFLKQPRDDDQRIEMQRKIIRLARARNELLQS